MALTKRTYTNNQTVITAENLNAIQDNIIANANAIANKADKNPEYETLNFGDVFTVPSGYTFNESSSKVYRKGNHIFAQLIATGTATASSGTFTPIKIKTAYIPRISQMIGGRINASSSGQSYNNASVMIAASTGNVVVYVSENKTYGNSSNSWATSTGMFIDWEL